MEDEDTAALLIEQAMGDVAVVECPQCRGKGHLPEALFLQCPTCFGSGKTTGKVIHGE